MVGEEKKQVHNANTNTSEELVSYSSYLKVKELTALQKPLSKPEAHDELLFIIVHQTYELWFKQILFETKALIQHIESDNLLPGYRLMDRICEIFKCLIQQVDILETMTPIEFNRFRSNLNPASGFQSQQFRELELLAGAPLSDYTKLFKLNPEWKEELSARLNQPNLRETFWDLLQRKGLIRADENSEKDRLPAILKIYNDPKHYDLHNLCEYLIRFDEQFSLWRFRHVQMVERMIGMKRGTGGSLGVKYLQSTLNKRFFPELWEARTHMSL